MWSLQLSFNNNVVSSAAFFSKIIDTSSKRVSGIFIIKPCTFSFYPCMTWVALFSLIFGQAFCHFSFTAHDTASWCMPLNQSQECLQMSIPYNLSKHSKLFWHGRSLGWTLGNQGSTMDKSDQHTEKVRDKKNPAKKVVQNM